MEKRKRIIAAVFFNALVLIWPVAGKSQQILVPPYIQPGNASALTKEQKVLIWQTDSVPGNFKAEYIKGEFEQDAKPLSAGISSVKVRVNNQTTIIYKATLSKLRFDETYSFRVSLPSRTIAENSFCSRTKKPESRFAVFGDCGAATPEQAQIAYQVYQQKPGFILVTGDMVYNRGLGREYIRNFFPYYLSPVASIARGAPLMSTIPFYMIVGNHDVYGANLDNYTDGLFYFHYADLPLNAPLTEFQVPLTGDPERVKQFKKITRPKFPGMTNYSFDHGNVHVVCLDSNPYVNPLDPTLTAWLHDDLKNTKADWKIVSYHHPGFNAGKAHYDDQRMRLLAPLLEELKVDLVLTGHVHNYQRSVPLKFSPKKDDSGKMYLVSPEGRIDGSFILDQHYDGITQTKPSGIIYIVTGAGGAPLYDKDLDGNPGFWKDQRPGNWDAFTAKIVSGIHSFSLIETAGKKLKLKQVDINGVTIDEIEITK